MASQAYREEMDPRRVLVTGSTTGLGFAAALELTAGGHDVVFHARNRQRASSLPAAATVVIGDLGEPEQVADVADQIRQLELLDAVIHNAGIDGTAERTVNSHGQPLVTAVNLYAPYLLTALLGPIPRLIYLSSDMHVSGRADLDDLDWTKRRWNGTQAYCDSKLHVTTLAFAIAAHWPNVRANAVDPGWVPTRMGGPTATDDLTLGHQTQTWLATSDDPTADTTGRYWYHQQPQHAAPAASNQAFQAALLERLEPITGIAIT
jgi:NAD(P)-dependent dehydrogenase (short-subunit alcohol dehydrogenase family)